MGRSTKNVRTQFWDARQFLWKWVDTVQMLHIVDMLQMFQMLVEYYYCLCNVTVACGMLLLLVERYYCLLSVTIACGMLLLLVECHDCLWNVTIACVMLRLLV